MRPRLTIDKNDGKDIDASLTLKAQSAFLSSTSEKIIRSLLHQKPIQFLLQKSDIDQKEIKFISVEKEDLKKKSFEVAKTVTGTYVTTLDVFTAYLLLTEPQTKLLFSKELKEEDLLEILKWAREENSNEERLQPIRVHLSGKGFADDWVHGWTLETQKYTTDFTKTALQNSLKLVDRKEELQRVISVLQKSSGHNAILIGEPGVGIRMVVEEFAKQSFYGNLPSHLSHKRLLELSVGMLLAGAENPGKLEERIQTILLELEHAGDVIVFIPEIETIAGAGGLSIDATGALMPALLSEKIQIIGTTTPSSYKTYIEGKKTFSELFESVPIEEPSILSAIHMIEESSLFLDRKHHVVIPYSVISETVTLASHYLPDKRLPGKAVQLLDDTSLKALSEKRKVVTKEDIQIIIRQKTNVPVGKPQKDEKEQLLHLEDELHKRVIGQDFAVTTVSQALRRLRAGIKTGSRPVGVFLFLGPTGVGKTELAKALASFYFGNENSMIRIDMGEYKDSQSLYRLIGSPPGMGIERGELSEKVRDNPFSLVLLDEFEKAHPDIQDTFLSVFDEGKLTDSKGRGILFTQTIIIATSNAGAELIRENLQKGVAIEVFQNSLVDELLKQGIFKPELINRFDSVVVFKSLTDGEMKKVIQLLLQEVTRKLKEQDITVLFDENVINLIAEKGYDREFGARPLRRYIQDTIEDKLAEKILKEEIKRGDSVIVAAENNTIVLR